MKSDETGTLSEHVQLVRLPDLQAWTRNPHKHPESQLSTLASNIRTFGFTSLPVLAFYPGETRGFVSSGNGRLESLHLLRAQYPQNPPPGIDTDTDGEWLIPVRPMQFPSRLIAEAQGLSDNWIASMPGVEDDTEKLAEILHDLQEQEIDFSGLGKDMDDLAAILAEPPVEPSADDDDAPEPPAEAVSRLGYLELWTGKPKDLHECAACGAQFVGGNERQGHYEKRHLHVLTPEQEDARIDREERFLNEVAPLRMEMTEASR
jgi:hypothetical protein